MKNSKFVLVFLPLITVFLFLCGCRQPFFEKPENEDPGQGVLLVSLSGSQVEPSLSARTMLPLNPEFTKYELEFSGEQEPVEFYNSSTRLSLTAGSYTITAKGYTGDTLSARSEQKTVSIPNEGFVEEEFVLKPYMETSIPGILSYSLSWDGVSRMPDRAELLIETYSDETPIPISLIPQDLSIGSAPGTILLLEKDSALVKLNGALTLPAGEYRLTMSVTMDEGDDPVSRMDIAQVYSNLTTPGSFYYGGGDLIISSAGLDPGAGFITRFTFRETPSATTVIGSVPGTDGTRLIMVMVPNITAEGGPVDLKSLTPVVETAPGAVISSPLPLLPPSPAFPAPGYSKGQIDFSNPTVWTAVNKKGSAQQYTVVVSQAPAAPAEKRITYFFFKEYPGYPAIIDQDQGTINVVVPYGAKAARPDYTLTPIVSFIGKRVVYVDEADAESVLNGNGGDSPLPFADTPILRVYAEDNGSKDYVVMVLEALNNEAEITGFVIEGYPDVKAAISKNPDDEGYYSITAALPYGAALTGLKPLIQYKGKTLDPASGVVRDFNAPAFYKVTAYDNAAFKNYKVILSNEGADKDTGIFDFVITNVPRSKVVIGQNPRQDGKIPIVVQVPYGTDERNMIPAITLRSPKSTISPASGQVIPFRNQEAVYTVTAEDKTTTQQYVVVVSQGPQYYYVDGQNGSDTWPDYYNGGSEFYPFKTLAYAVQKAAEDGIDKILVKGELNSLNQTGPDAALPDDAGSVIAINGSNGKKITVTGIGGGAVFRGTGGKRVVSVTGGAEISFENITITGGVAPASSNNGKGGGLYVGSNSKVKFSGGSITENEARLGGGVFIEGFGDDHSEFTLMGGTISNNKATSSSVSVSSDTDPLGGGGGVYVNGNALFWLADGTISGNTAPGGSGAGVLVRGTLEGYGPQDENSGFIMSGGSIANNISRGSKSPHGGGGVYVASGEFDMLDGSIIGNTATRQGGGVFVRTGAIFHASGNSSITGNSGVGSSSGICSRGITELTGNAQTQTIYVWNPLIEDGGIPENEFTLSENARARAIVLAYSAEYRNYVWLTRIDGTDQIATIDLEGHLTPPTYAFVDTNLEGDWLNQSLLKGAAVDANMAARFPLGAFVGGRTLPLSPYKIDASGKLVKK
jgi:hypothetical protein